MARFLKLAAALIILMFAIACNQPLETNSNSQQLSTPSVVAIETTSISTTLSEEVTKRVRTEIAQRLELQPEQIQIKNASLVEWNDACLGLPQVDELCAQRVTPGYEIGVATSKGDYQIHSDRTGSAVRVAN